jgi:hypothetical protein
MPVAALVAVDGLSLLRIHAPSTMAYLGCPAKLLHYYQQRVVYRTRVTVGRTERYQVIAEYLISVIGLALLTTRLGINAQEDLGVGHQLRGHKLFGNITGKKFPVYVHQLNLRINI